MFFKNSNMTQKYTYLRTVPLATNCTTGLVANTIFDFECLYYFRCGAPEGALP